MTSIVEVIQHYQRSIDSSQDNEARLLHCINKLYKLPIKVEHLQETGVGKTVNSLRKFNGEIGVAAKTLVTKWKAMVAAEEEPMENSSQLTENETHNDTNGDEGGTSPHDDEEDENHNRHNTSQQNDDCKNHKKDSKEKFRDQNKSSSSDHKDNGKSSKHLNEKHKSSTFSKDEKSSCSKDKEREKEKTEHKSSRDKHKERHHDKNKEKDNHKKSASHKGSSKSKSEDKKQNDRSDKHKISSKDKERTKNSVSSKEKQESQSSSSSSICKPSTKDPDNDERKRRYNSDNDSNDFKSPQPKMAKVNKSTCSKTATKKDSSSSSSKASEEEERDDSFDSSMGANFDDVLGMLNMPLKKNKKLLKSPSTSVNSSNAIKRDINPHKQSTNNNNDIARKINGEQTTPYSPQVNSKAMKPDLLAPTAKLEPLDPSIALELPTISTNYKPMPLNQTVMDCVFNNSSSSSKPVRIFSDAEAITHGISSKTMRTKIYSGVRTGQTFQVPSLFDMCIRILQKNIDALEYTGGVPFEVLKPVLERATPQQLYVFEEYNPYLMEDSDVLWQQHVARNFRTKKRLENESWREMFIRCQEEEERRLSVLKDSIKASQKIAAAPLRKTQLAFVDSMVKPPRNILKKQEQFGTKGKLVATPAARVASLSSVTPNAAKTGDQRLKIPTAVRDHAQVSNSSIRPKKAPLMQKTLQFIRGRHKR